jgi:hypothetical protein
MANSRQCRAAGHRLVMEAEPCAASFALAAL